VICYQYNSQLEPPAPFVYVTLRNPVTGQELHTVPAQLDSAADRTLLPDVSVQTLALPRIREIRIGVAGGGVHTMPAYPVVVAIHDLPHQTIEAVAIAGEHWVVLGRDILNAHRIVLDGPKLSLEVGE
jgi:hypothetical protein